MRTPQCVGSIYTVAFINYLSGLISKMDICYFQKVEAIPLFGVQLAFIYYFYDEIF